MRMSSVWLAVCFIYHLTAALPLSARDTGIDAGTYPTAADVKRG